MLRRVLIRAILTITLTCWVLVAALPGDAVAQGAPPLPGTPTPTSQMPALSARTLADYNAKLGSISPVLRPLHDQLSDRDPAVRIAATQSMALAGGDEAALLLLRSMSQDFERDPAVRMEAARSLGEIGGTRALEVLGVGLLDREDALRRKVVQELRWAGTVFAIPYIGDRIKFDTNEGVRLEGVRMLRKIGTQFAVQYLADAMFTDRSMMIRRASADALGELGKKEIQVAGILGRAYQNEPDIGVRLEIVGSMGLVRNKAGLPFLEQAMLDPDTAVRMRATQVYGRVVGLQ